MREVISNPNGPHAQLLGIYPLTNAANTAFPPHIRLASYNRGYVKDRGPRIRYPFGNGPLTNQEAFAKLRAAEGAEPLQPFNTDYEPSDVLETLKLLSKGDLSDEQLDIYEQDKGRLRVFVALKKQRQLTEDEQATVNEIGLRLDVEVAQLAGEDLGFARSKQATIDELMRARDVVEAQRVTETIEREREQRLRPVLNADAEFRGLEDEEVFGYPPAISNLDSERMAARLAELREIYDARDLQLRRSTRFADRNMTTALVRNTDPDVLTAAAAISQAQTESSEGQPSFRTIACKDRRADAPTDGCS